MYVHFFYQIGSVLHEIGHVLGLFHEHTRPDRDLYLTINTENVWEGRTYLHLVNDSGTFTYSKTLGIPYDHASVMHYSAYVRFVLMVFVYLVYWLSPVGKRVVDSRATVR